MKRILANIVEMTELMHLKHFSCKVMRRVCTVQLGFGCNYQVGGEAVQVKIAHLISCSKFKQYLVASMYEVDREVVQVNIAHPISCSKLNADFGAKQYLVAYFSLDNCPLFINITHHKYV